MAETRSALRRRRTAFAVALVLALGGMAFLVVSISQHQDAHDDLVEARVQLATQRATASKDSKRVRDAQYVVATVHDQLAALEPGVAGLADLDQKDLDAVRAAAAPHSFAGVSHSGTPAILHTTGNPDGHVILRGGSGEPNHTQAGVKAALATAIAGMHDIQPRALRALFTNHPLVIGYHRVVDDFDAEVRTEMPGMLISRISPPKRRASSRLIASPKPVPPYLRLVLPSACWNASKILCCLSGGMPMPRNERIASSRMALAQMKVPCTISGGMVFGNTCRIRISGSRVPTAIAAST